MRPLNHLVPVRISLTLLAVGLVVFNTVAVQVWGGGISDEIMGTMLALIGAAIAADTWRPSGVVKMPTAVTPSALTPEVRHKLEGLTRELNRRRTDGAPKLSVPAPPTPGVEGQ